MTFIHFLGKSVDMPIAMGKSCSTVCMSVTIIRTGQILANILIVKNDVYRHLQSGCDIASVVLRDRDQLFQGHIFQMLISQKR